MGARNFRAFVQSLLPTWLTKPDGFGQRMSVGVIGYTADLIAEANSQAIKAGWVKQDSSPDDALPGIGENFNIKQVSGESNAAFRARLTNTPGAWVLWQEAATDQFVINALAPFGVDPSQILLVARVLEAVGNWSTWRVVLEPQPGLPLPWDEATWGGDPWGDWGTKSQTWGTDATQAEIFGIIRLLCKWKSAHEIGVDVILNYDDHIWGFGTWGAPKTWGINGVVGWVLGRFWGGDYKAHVWADKETYRPQLDAVWGGKIRV